MYQPVLFKEDSKVLKIKYESQATFFLRNSYETKKEWGEKKLKYKEIGVASMVITDN